MGRRIVRGGTAPGKEAGDPVELLKKAGFQVAEGKIVGTFAIGIGSVELPPNGNQVVDSPIIAFGISLRAPIDDQGSREEALLGTVMKRE